MDASKFTEEIHIIKRIAIVVVIFFIMTLLHYSTLINESDPAVFSITLLGFMLILSYNLGKILSRLKLPKLTIYILTGILCGPFVTGFVSQEVVANLKFVDNLALSMIAFIAGGEMRFGELKKMRKLLIGISFYETMYVLFSITIAFFLLHPFISFTAGQSWLFVGIVSLLMGSMLIANSPAVTIGIIGEYRSKGHLTDTVLGTVVLKDIIVIVVFAIIASFASTQLLPDATFDLVPFVSKLGYEILGSIGLGIAIGLLVWLYMRFIMEQTVLFIVGIAFASFELAHYFHLEVLLVGVTAGFYVQNFTRQGQKLIANIEESLPVIYPIFFSIAGAKLDLMALQSMWFIALVLVAVRMVGIYMGVKAGSRSDGATKEIRQYAWMGLVSQAGVALGLAVVVERTYPEWGGVLQTIVISVIGINQLIGPVLLKYALEKAGDLQSSSKMAETLIRLKIGEDAEQETGSVAPSMESRNG
ncbi:cation:proton antiporter [bacterium]|nr:cation:proton antiporter [bacterium]